MPPGSHRLFVLRLLREAGVPRTLVATVLQTKSQNANNNIKWIILFGILFAISALLSVISGILYLFMVLCGSDRCRFQSRTLQRRGSWVERKKS